MGMILSHVKDANDLIRAALVCRRWCVEAFRHQWATLQRLDVLERYVRLIKLFATSLCELYVEATHYEYHGASQAGTCWLRSLRQRCCILVVRLIDVCLQSTYS
jgi:hypothetical protein